MRQRNKVMQFIMLTFVVLGFLVLNVKAHGYELERNAEYVKVRLNFKMHDKHQIHLVKSIGFYRVTYGYRGKFNLQFSKWVPYVSIGARYMLSDNVGLTYSTFYLASSEIQEKFLTKTKLYDVPQDKIGHSLRIFVVF